MMGEAEAAARSHAWRNLLSHLSAAGETARLFDLLETKPFLADQVEGLRGFQASGDDLENHALPAAITARDWQRFLHYAAVALNLRGLAEDLAAPEILRALVRAGRIELALDAAGRLPDLFGQVQALAAVASGCEGGAARQDVLRELEGRLDDLARETGRQASFAEALASVAQDTGPDLQGRWPEWIDRLAPGQAAQVWRAVAEGWMQRHNPHEAGLWQALEAIGEPSQILAFAPAGLGVMDLETPGEILRRLEALLPDLRDRQRAGAVLLGRLALRHPEQACAAWDDWSTRSLLVWSTELIDLGREVLGRLDPVRIEEIAVSLQEPEARAALRIVALEARRTSELAASALATLGSMPDGAVKLHWSLRYLAARPVEPEDEIRRQVIAAGRYLHATGFTAEARDLARWLDLVALHLRDQTGGQLDCVLWSPALTPDKVLSLVDAAKQPMVLDLLLERVERSAAALSSTEADGFLLRKELMIRAICRLCELNRSLEGLDRAAGRLLPEEEDELRSCLAPRLAEHAEEVCAGIGDRRLRLVTLLRSTSGLPPESLAPANLYEALARVEILDDERRGLRALLETPADPRGLLQTWVLPIRNPRIRTRALLRLARHALDFEVATHHRPDRLAPLELVRWLITTETDEELASLTPEIAALGAAAGGSRAIAEVQEAARQLAALETVAWPVRREALKNLLSRMADGLLPPKAAAAALLSILRLPEQLRPESARHQLRQHWSEILPWIAAVADRLPDKHLMPVRRALRKSLPETVGGGASETSTWCGPGADYEAGSIERLALWIADAAPDPSDPRIEPLLVRLWNAPDTWRPAIAWAVQDALRSGGRPRGEAVLRIWLHALLAPRPGRGRPEGLIDAADAERALDLALRLRPERGAS